MTNLSNKELSFINFAINEAKLSKCLMTHGCVAVSQGKIIGRGFNHHCNPTIDGFVNGQYTCHAEISAIRDAYYSKIYKSKSNHIKQKHVCPECNKEHEFVIDIESDVKVDNVEPRSIKFDNFGLEFVSKIPNLQALILLMEFKDKSKKFEDSKTPVNKEQLDEFYNLIYEIMHSFIKRIIS